MSLRSPLLSRWLSHPAELLHHNTPMLKPSPRLPFMRHKHQPQLMSLAGPSRTFSSLGRSLPNQGRTLDRVKGSNTRARIDHQIRSARHGQPRRPFTTSRNPESFSQRLRKLSREYGWAGLGVYLLLSAMDFPFCFMAVRLLGSDRIGHYEDMILKTVADGVHVVWPAREPTSEEAEEAAKEEEEEKKVKAAEARDQQAVAKKKADEASMSQSQSQLQSLPAPVPASRPPPAPTPLFHC